MRSNEDIEAFLLETGLGFEPLGDGLWIISDEDDGVENVVLHHEQPYLTVRLKVMPLPSERREEFFEKLLRLNRTEMVHGAFGIEDEAVVITDTIQSPNLDLNELQATLEAVILAVSEHYQMLSAYK